MIKVNMKRILSAVVFSTVFTSLTVMASPADWQAIRSPIPSKNGEPEPIGSYSNGCILSAEAMPAKGDGYQVIRMNKNRFYGHPEVINYLKRLGKKVKETGMPSMLIGDISMPAGGRFLTGHASHQMGLDVDIWLRMGEMSEQDAENSDGKALLVVNRATQRVDENIWNNNHFNLIKLAAQDSQVTRIFVNPAIKVKLCQTEQTDRSWLRKIRPWWGHDSHFHVRLECPEGATYCESQDPVPAGDGCGAELYSWFEPKAPSTTVKKVTPPEHFMCQQVISSQKER